MTQREVNSFIDCMRIERQASVHTVAAYRSDLADFGAWLRGKNPAAAVEADIHGYLSHCSERKLAPSTISRRISVLREFFRQLQRERRIRQDPMRRILSPKAWKRIPKAISAEEVLKLLDFPLGLFHNKVLGLRDRAIIELFWASGIRVSELTSAKLADLDLENRTLLIFGKGSKERKTPFGLPAARALNTYLTDARPKLIDRCYSPFLFVGRRGRQFTRQRIWQVIKERAAQAGLHQRLLSPHVMRHTCATHMVENAADLRTVQEILGHADISTTERYLKASPAHLKEVFARCHPRNNSKHLQMRLFDEKAPSIVTGLTLCTHCLKLAVIGKTMCERHLLSGRIAVERHREKKKAKPVEIDKKRVA